MNVNCRTYVLPRKFADHAAQSHSHESDIFRVPLPLSSVKAAHREAVWSRPTVILPTFQNIMSFTDHSSALLDLNSEVTNGVAWICQIIGANKHLFEAKYTATQLIGPPLSVLRSFLSQIEPPQRAVSMKVRKLQSANESTIPSVWSAATDVDIHGGNAWDFTWMCILKLATRILEDGWNHRGIVGPCWSRWLLCLGLGQRSPRRGSQGL